MNMVPETMAYSANWFVALKLLERGKHIMNTNLSSSLAQRDLLPRIRPARAPKLRNRFVDGR
jgi:hypothetical protein